ncbi:Unknown protein sequence [Pseudomonas savastanoi pv. phaseolicola]|nr:Unknown protein sequence [Pseudomonas savastanoi pv. phaseolicola]KPB74819.1 Unknown protein sequence [Pseudomonas amygdali pv. mellea]
MMSLPALHQDCSGYAESPALQGFQVSGGAQLSAFQAAALLRLKK